MISIFKILDTKNSSYSAGKNILYFAFLLFSLILTSCFTGVEGTKKIKLSREDRKTLAPSAEEQFFVGVKGIPLSEWEKGKTFIAADDKTILLFEQDGLSPDPLSVGIGGKILSFEGIDKRLGADGETYAAIVFSNNGHPYVYNTGKTFDVALEIRSDQIPMLIDEDMVREARELLMGKQLWIKSPLWYDNNGNRINGFKYVAITITDVEPASVAFPLKLRFTNNEGKYAWVYMNYGNSGTESRSFPALFSLTDIRNRYPTVQDDVWEMICRGRVKNGMTKLECKLSLGNPQEVSSGHDYSQTLDLWHYSDGTTLWFEDGLLTKFRQ